MVFLFSPKCSKEVSEKERKTVFIKKNIAVKKLNCVSLQVTNISNDL